MDQIVTNNSSLSIVTCPTCHRAISVYMDTGPDTQMACPLCKSTYPFQSVLDGLPPMLQVASEATAELQLQPVEADRKFSFDEVPAPPSPRRSTNKSRRRSSQAKDSENAKRERSEKALRRERSERKRKRAFKKSSPLRETILFVLGGLLALPVGQLIIWWVIGKDPLNFGPNVANVAPFAVPEKFHGDNAAGDDEADGDGTDGNEANNDQAKDGDPAVTNNSNEPQNNNAKTGKGKNDPNQPTQKLPVPNLNPDKLGLKNLDRPPTGQNDGKQKK